jgi:peptidoglycan hydrolase CwlO-like protein
MKELCDMVIELESLLYWRRELGGRQYLQSCNSKEYEEVSEDQWEGKVRELDNKLVSILDKVSTIDGSNKTIVSKLESLQKSIDALTNAKQ